MKNEKVREKRTGDEGVRVREEGSKLETERELERRVEINRGERKRIVNVEREREGEK